MISIHDVLNILIVKVLWIEKEPQLWMVSSIQEITSLDKYPTDGYPQALQERIAEFKVIINGVVSGRVSKIPDNLIDFAGHDLTYNQLKVLQTLMEVPRGQVITYKDLAIKSGLGPNAARFVGNTMHKNYWPIIIPCHRVVKSDYHVGNYSLYDPDYKEQLLVAEGVNIINHKCHF